MDKKDLESKRLPDLKVIAKSIGLKGFETLKKADLINAIIGGSTPQPSVESTENSKEKVEKAVEKPKRARTIKKVIVAEEAPKVTLEDKKTNKGRICFPFLLTIYCVTLSKRGTFDSSASLK